MNKFVLIKGVHLENKGAELMLWAIVHACDSYASKKNLQFVLPWRVSSQISKRFEINVLSYFSFSYNGIDLNVVSRLIPKFCRKILEKYFAIVLEVDLVAVLDASGYAYGDHWPQANCQRVGSMSRRIHRQGGQYIFMPQAFGDFANPKVQRSMEKAFAYAEHVFVRDKQSLENISNLTSKGLLFPDFTNIIPTVNAKNSAGLLIVPNLNMVRSDKGMAKSKYFSLLKKLCEIFAEFLPDERISIMNHEGYDEFLFCQEIVYFLENNEIETQLINPETAKTAKFLIESQRIVFASRYHACVTALNAGIPCFASSWAHKYEELFDEFYSRDCLLSNADVSDDESLEAFYNIFRSSVLVAGRPVDRYGKVATLRRSKVEQMFIKIFDDITATGLARDRGWDKRI